MPQSKNDQASEKPTGQESFTGRSVFLVETTAAGISVQTALLSTDSQLLRAPAVFPDIDYAFSQIDELKRLVSRHFSEAARVGAQLVAAQQLNQSKPSATGPANTPSPAAAEKRQPQTRTAKTKKSLSR